MLDSFFSVGPFLVESIITIDILSRFQLRRLKNFFKKDNRNEEDLRLDTGGPTSLFNDWHMWIVQMSDPEFF